MVEDKRLTESDFQYYTSLEVWSPLEAVCLINGLNPEETFPPFPDKIKNLLEAIHRAWEARFQIRSNFKLFINLPLKNSLDLKRTPEFVSISNHWERGDEYRMLYLYSSEYKKWAEEKGFPIPEELKTISSKVHALDLKNDLCICESTDLYWTDITASFINDNELLFQFRGQNATRSYEMAGFMNQKNKMPINAWIALQEASKKGGELPYNFQSRKKIEKIAQNIREKFRKLFPNIEGDPIPINKGFYKTIFHLKNTAE